MDHILRSRGDLAANFVYQGPEKEIQIGFLHSELFKDLARGDCEVLYCLLWRLGEDWVYDLVDHNCNHFALAVFDIVVSQSNRPPNIRSTISGYNTAARFLQMTPTPMQSLVRKVAA